MRVLLASLVLAFSLPSWADDAVALYQATGWPEQRGHFRDALQAAQQRYQNSLPPALYQSLVDTSNRRYTAAIDQRALAALRQALPNDGPALQFFQSPLGHKVVTAEIAATRADQLAKNAGGLPQVQASAARRAQVKRLAAALPLREAGAEVSVALAGLAADSLSQMLPGLMGQQQSGDMIEQQRQKFIAQMNAGDLENTLLYVYRTLSDAELGQFADFAASADGAAYYRAAVAALRAGLGGQ